MVLADRDYIKARLLSIEAESHKSDVALKWANRQLEELRAELVFNHRLNLILLFILGVGILGLYWVVFIS